MKRALIGAAALLLSACAGLTTPPIDTPHAKSSVTLSQMSNGQVPEGAAAPATVPPIQGFKVNDPEGLAIDVPSNARSVNLATAVLHLKLTNHMQIPLTLQFYLSKTNRPYEDASASLTPQALTIEANESKQIDKQGDPTMFKQEKLYLGVVYGTSGTFPRIVTVSGSDAIETETWATVQVKLL